MSRYKTAEMWWCGDDECNCNQPRVMEYSTEKYGKSGWKPPKVIEEGPFLSHPTPDEMHEIKAWLEKARAMLSKGPHNEQN